MTDTTGQQQAADRVAKLIDDLNEAIWRASEDGLVIQIDRVDQQQAGHAHTRPVLTASVLRRLA